MEPSVPPRPDFGWSTAAERPAARQPGGGVPTAAIEPPADVDPAVRTARWLMQTYGPVEAENRAAIVEEFYSGEQRAFWRRVLADVRQTRQR